MKLRNIVALLLGSAVTTTLLTLVLWVFLTSAISYGTINTVTITKTVINFAITIFFMWNFAAFLGIKAQVRKNPALSTWLHFWYGFGAAFYIILQ